MLAVAQDRWALNLPDYWALPTRRLRDLRSQYEAALKVTTATDYYRAALQAVNVELQNRGIGYVPR